MGSDQAGNKWVFKSCENQFTPKPPDYRCPECGSNTTVPIMILPSIEQTQLEERVREEAQRLEELKIIRASELDTVGSLCSHLNDIGIKTRIVDAKGLEASAREIVSGYPYGCLKIEGRNIDQVLITINRTMTDKNTHTHQFWHQYFIATEVHGPEWESTASTKLKEKSLADETVVGLKWIGDIPPDKGPIGNLFVDRRESSRLSQLLNADVELNSKLVELGRSVHVVPNKEAGCVWMVSSEMIEYFTSGVLVYFGGAEEWVTGRATFPSRVVFDVFDRIAGHVISNIRALKSS